MQDQQNKIDYILNHLDEFRATDEEIKKAWEENQRDSQVILSEYELDGVEKTVVWAAGIIAGVVDAFFVTDVR